MNIGIKYINRSDIIAEATKLTIENKLLYPELIKKIYDDIFEKNNILSNDDIILFSNHFKLSLELEKEDL